MYRMEKTVEILLTILLILVVVGQPSFLHKFSYSLLGKMIFVAGMIFAAYHSLASGVLVFLIFITLRKDYTLVEGMDNEEDSSDKEDESSDNEESSDDEDESFNKGDFVEKYCKNGKVDKSTNPPTLKYIDGKCNPCDTSCEFEITNAKEQMSVDEALRPKESNSIPVEKK